MAMKRETGIYCHSCSKDFRNGIMLQGREGKHPGADLVSCCMARD